MSTSKILIICPTRERGYKIKEFYDMFKEKSSICDLVFSLDKDDEVNYPKFDDKGTFYEIGYRNDIVPAINYVAYKYAQNKQYEFIGILNDDHVIRTDFWDKIIYDKIKGNNFAIAYPNDLYPNSKDNYASSVIMGSELIRCLGYMATPTLKHFYPDAIWIELGKKINQLYYFDDVIIEHMHYTINKSQVDSLYQYVGDFNNGTIAKRDRKFYNQYKEMFLDNDVIKIKKYMEMYDE